jgi:hypothetical protein
MTWLCFFRGEAHALAHGQYNRQHPNSNLAPTFSDHRGAKEGSLPRWRIAFFYRRLNILCASTWTIAPSRHIVKSLFQL